MTSKQRAYLKSLANTLPCIFQIGKQGVSDVLINELNNSLEARELIKIHILETAPENIRTIASIISENTNSEVVQILGAKITLFRQRNEKSKIELP